MSSEVRLVLNLYGCSWTCACDCQEEDATCSAQSHATTFSPSG
jgi:hypothetical protein